MSRLGKKPIEIPEKTEASFASGLFAVKGPLGELRKKFRDEIDIKIEDKKISLSPRRKNELSKALWGTYASHISNMIRGVNSPYEKKLIIEGVGFKSAIQDKKLTMSLGFSHPVEVLIPDGITASAEKNVITLSGIDKELLGQFAAKVRALKKPEPYKGKGIRYAEEIVRRKQGKKTA
ncbi:50S ribosomal protein L6 [Candidatus Campbellbacteria bacterium CG11_big_fil_rev_8_21_14_0_20_44_21]|uniref:Large ribosomal subunit protein uL6 n=1 Tax=Candidatus Campbellbacteria bacterium CG22_combo_CG10-13_8_21_14_all_43_18 TaxID=1974530 RepID=A0A2H0DX13_9BACT|nr:MAG: 50S ribosomal protein L6 [Candidatus Campbellbacteria bacterium CG22_combo_CG10-13_8_21_14_all_43_18]PIR24346.1 MAG: 50S ribosomal protein L6 [Candidatus Campbellbacteria bacterium CG11_big_fil_rev_8_21_14_0_20_44_21]